MPAEHNHSGEMPPLSRREILAGYILLAIKVIRHPRRAARRVWEIIREEDMDSL